MKFFKSLLIFSSLAFTGPTSFADHGHGGGYDPGGGNGNFEKKRIVLNYYNQQFRGQNTLYLKKALRQQTQQNTYGMELKAVKIVAKSKLGHGTATLCVGQFQSNAFTLNGRPHDFFSNEGFTYDRVRIKAQSYSSRGPWQILLKGNIKVKKVILIFKKRGGYNQNQNIVLNLNGQHFRGQTQFPLKMKIKQMYPNINLQFKKIGSITVYAKSKRGHGKISFMTGYNQTYEQNIPGNEYLFNEYGNYSYTPISIRNIQGGPYAAQANQWKLHLKGNIKILKIEVKFKNAPVFSVR